jgi:hypothetical protein
MDCLQQTCASSTTSHGSFLRVSRQTLRGVIRYSSRYARRKCTSLISTLYTTAQLCDADRWEGCQSSSMPDIMTRSPGSICVSSSSLLVSHLSRWVSADDSAAFSDSLHRLISLSWFGLSSTSETSLKSAPAPGRQTGRPRHSL